MYKLKNLLSVINPWQASPFFCAADERVWFEALVTGMGGVKVFEGKGEDMDIVRQEFSDMRHRSPVYGTDQMGIYMVRTPDSEIWVEAYINPNHRGPYYLTVVDKKTLEVKASLLARDEPFGVKIFLHLLRGEHQLRF